MLNFIDGLLIGTLLTLLIYKIYWETKFTKVEKESEETIRTIINKLLADENDLPIEREEEK